jgi:hypothetical protein
VGGWLLIDIEASGAGRGGVPIELAWADPATGRGGCSLVRPPPEWRVPGWWDAAAEAVHRIPPARLEAEGRPPGEVAAAFLRAAASRRVLSDMPMLDQMWLDRLVGRGTVEVRDFWEEVRRLGGGVRLGPALAEMDGLGMARHRAAADVRRLLWIWRKTAGADAAPPIRP